MRPSHDGSTASRRSAHGSHDQSGGECLPSGDVGGNIGDAPGLGPRDRGRYRLLANDLSQFSFRLDLAGGRVKRRSRRIGAAPAMFTAVATKSSRGIPKWRFFSSFSLHGEKAIENFDYGQGRRCWQRK